MDQETPIARDIVETGADARYDAEAKKLLANRPFLAWILKCCAEEFEPFDIATIIGYIENPEIGTHAVNQDEQRLLDQAGQKIEGLQTENKSITEGTVTYDIRFLVTVPDTSDKIQMFINVEAQLNDTGLGYPLMNRVVYYLARMISSQKGTVFGEKDYGRIRKVYSIWIVSNPRSGNANTIEKFSIKPDHIFGEACYGESEYDLMTGVMVNLKADDESVGNDLLKLMNVLLSAKIPADRKKEIIEREFNIPMTRKIEKEVDHMCNLSQGIYEDGRIAAIDQFIKAGASDELIIKATGKTKEYIDNRRKALNNDKVPAEA